MKNYKIRNANKIRKRIGKIDPVFNIKYIHICIEREGDYIGRERGEAIYDGVWGKGVCVV